MKKQVKEEISTGASFATGAGEQFMTNAWIGGRKKKRKIKESVSYTPEKRGEIYKNAETKLKEYEDYLQKYFNVVASLSLEEIVKNDAKLKRIIEAGEKLEGVFEKLHDQLDDIAWSYSDEDDHANYEKFLKLSDKYNIMRQDTYDTYSLMEKVNDKIEDFREDKPKLIAKLFK